MVAAIEPLLRAKLLMALIGLVVLGGGMLALIVLGGRYARRIVRTPLPPSRSHEDRWYAKPLVPQEPEPELTDSENDGREPDSQGDANEPDAG